VEILQNSINSSFFKNQFLALLSANVTLRGGDADFKKRTCSVKISHPPIEVEHFVEQEYF
jgi:hypothetical protein